MITYSTDISYPVFEPIQEDNTTRAQTVESEGLANYEEYARRELPRLFRSTLETIVHNETRPIEERLKSQLTSIIQECQDRVFSSYRASLSFPMPSPSHMIEAEKLAENNDKESVDFQINQRPEILEISHSYHGSALEHPGPLFRRSSQEFTGSDSPNMSAPELFKSSDLLKNGHSTITASTSISQVQNPQPGSEAYSNNFNEERIVSKPLTNDCRDLRTPCGEELVAMPGLSTIEWPTTPPGGNLEHFGWDVGWLDESQAGAAYLPGYSGS